MIRIFNTAARKTQAFKPVDEGAVSWYNCGPTVYDYIHVGNARNAVCMDFLRRYLMYRGYKVTYIQNYTDIDDKMIHKAMEMNIPVKAVAEKFIAAYEQDASALGVLLPDYAPKATDHIAQMVVLIKALVNEGKAYETEDGIYFDIRKFNRYGKHHIYNVGNLFSNRMVFTMLAYIHSAYFSARFSQLPHFFGQ